jgi:hypothetical protein
MRWSLLVVLGMVASTARAEEARPRSIWLECKAPAVWPARAGTPLLLSCRVEPAAAGPAFWQTVNPFVPDRSSELLDPFSVEAAPRSLLDLFDRGRRSRPVQVTRPRPPEPLSDELLSPFEVFPEKPETINPFEPNREEAGERPPR